MRLLVILLCLEWRGVWSEPISLAVGVSTAVGIGLGYFGLRKKMLGYCRFYECCQEPWLRPNISGYADIPSLRSTLEARLYGQPLVLETVVGAVNAHLSRAQPHKALVLSFHGSAGVGKTYVSRFIADAVFKRGISSEHFHVITCSHVFPHKQRVVEYKETLMSWIRGNVSECERSVFVFDDLDKAQPEILDALHPFLDDHVHFPNADPRKAIFLLISNTGGGDITDAALTAWQAGRGRAELSLKEMEAVIHVAAYNTPGGLQFSRLMEHQLVDHFIPFLPLERPQRGVGSREGGQRWLEVELCIRDNLRSVRGGVRETEEEVAAIVEMLPFVPKGLGLYSPSGCRRVPSKVQLYLEQQRELLEMERENGGEL